MGPQAHVARVLGAHVPQRTHKPSPALLQPLPNLHNRLLPGVARRCNGLVGCRVLEGREVLWGTGLSVALFRISCWRQRAELRRLAPRPDSRRPCHRGAVGEAGRHRGSPVSWIASRSPWRVDQIARRRLPCAKRALLLSCRHLRAERRLPTAQFRKDAPEEP
jgi:hypothetical protein